MFRIDGEIVKLDGQPRTLNKKIKHFIDVVVDRVQLKEAATGRIAEAVELATKLAEGRVLCRCSVPMASLRARRGCLQRSKRRSWRRRVSVLAGIGLS